MAKLSKGMIDHINKIIKDNAAGFYYEYREDSLTPTANIRVIDPVGWVDSSIINLTSEFLDWLKGWFKDNYDVEITFNNTRTIFWSNDFNS